MAARWTEGEAFSPFGRLTTLTDSHRRDGRQREPPGSYNCGICGYPDGQGLAHALRASHVLPEGLLMSGCSPRVDLAKKGAKAPLPEPYWWRFLVGRLPDQGVRAEPGHERQMQTLRHPLRPKMEGEGTKVT